MLLNQIWLVSTLVAIFLALAVVYVCYNRQEELFESETARQAALRLKHRAHRAYTSIWKTPQENPPIEETGAGRYYKLQKGNTAVQTIPEGQPE
ncbi:hypothetical protein RRG08_034886 [Elysia crispata]|uniref:Uncharacterized protein n=1 Tax=Elysia crispata TaxID=231223 RepID=A0AAE1DM15_9GAST|nr:hypothetical protein RRG08_034886 [Elysia crispata]KAK3774795.1 hypothetical protein RRG08_034886 [Elysia crispata]KAK3774796.1 hypothetical protein RRG08_034886 [Elysia crispata]